MGPRSITSTPSPVHPLPPSSLLRKRPAEGEGHYLPFAQALIFFVFFLADIGLSFASIHFGFYFATVVYGGLLNESVMISLNFFNNGHQSSTALRTGV